MLSLQEWMKWESEQNIINSLHDKDRTFTELVDEIPEVYIKEFMKGETLEEQKQNLIQELISITQPMGPEYLFFLNPSVDNTGCLYDVLRETH